MTIQASSPTSSCTLLYSSITLFCVLLRVLMAYQPHSGQDNYQGTTTEKSNSGAYGGDFEAQRHWMEITYSLPTIGQWYWYDLHYWGLDYPPLTAYHSLFCGVLSRWLVGPSSVALDTSRGFEDPMHKAFMRATVLFFDLLVYFTSVFVLTRSLQLQSFPIKNTGTGTTAKRIAWMLLLALAQPAIILIDHGHFQYNTISLGLALWSFYYMTRQEQQQHGVLPDYVVGSILFCLALNFKQMTLYYAPVVFSFLLGQCFASSNLDDNNKINFSVKRFLALATTVIITFAVLWWPFIVYGPETTTMLERFVHVLGRLFPFQRGLFEGKVSNLWCALSTKPFSIRRRIPTSWQPLVALGGTVCLILPSCIAMFQMGRQRRRRQEQQCRSLFLWACTSCSLGFFLASFQVHEKSLLMAVAPMSLLLYQDIKLVTWFSMVSTWTLWPLLQVDRLQIGYFCIMIIFSMLLWIHHLEVVVDDNHEENKQEGEKSKRKWQSILDSNALTRLIVPLSIVIMMGLHILEMYIVPPAHLPDLFAVLWSIVGCGLLCLTWLATCVHLWSPLESTKLEKLE